MIVPETTGSSVDDSDINGVHEPKPNPALDATWLSVTPEEAPKKRRVIRVAIPQRKRKVSPNGNDRNVVDFKKFRKNYVAALHAQ